MKIPIISRVLAHNAEVMQRLKHEQETKNSRNRRCESKPQQRFNSSQDFKKAPGKVPVWVTPEQYQKYYVSNADKQSMNSGSSVKGAAPFFFAELGIIGLFNWVTHTFKKAK